MRYSSFLNLKVRVALLSWGIFLRFSMFWSELATFCCAYNRLLRILSVWEITERRRRACCGIGACSENGEKMRSRTILGTDRRARIPSPWRWPEGIPLDILE